MEIKEIIQILKKEQFKFVDKIKSAEKELLKEFVNGKTINLYDKDFYINVNLSCGLTQIKVKSITPDGDIIVVDDADREIITDDCDWLPFEALALLECLNYDESI